MLVSNVKLYPTQNNKRVHPSWTTAIHHQEVLKRLEYDLIINYRYTENHITSKSTQLDKV